MADSTQVINHLVRSLGVSAHDATAFVEVIHEIVEEQVTDDVSVIAPPLIVGRFGCPVLDRLMMRLRGPALEPPRERRHRARRPRRPAAAARRGHRGLPGHRPLRPAGQVPRPARGRPTRTPSCHLRMLDTWLATYADGPRARLRGAAHGQPRGLPRLAARPLRDARPLRLPRARRRPVSRTSSTAGRTPSTTADVPTWSRGSPTTATLVRTRRLAGRPAQDHRRRPQRPRRAGRPRRLAARRAGPPARRRARCTAC